MEDFDKRIEEAALREYPNHIFKEYEFGTDLSSISRSAWVAGVKSTEAKEYWQQGMYNEEKVFKLIDKIYTVGIYQKETYNKSINLKTWFEQNKNK